MRTTCYLLVAIAMIEFVTAQVAYAQSLPITKSTALNPRDKTAIRNYVKEWVELLREGSDREIGEAKRQLNKPIRRDATDYFLIEYRRALGPKLRELFASEPAQKRDIIRINVMIVAFELRDTDSSMLLVLGLKDKNPAVRYWSANAVGNFGNSKIQLKVEQQKDVLKSLGKALESEKVETVFQQLMLAMVDLNISDARLAVLDVLNKRVEVHMARPQIPIAAEEKCMASLIVRMVQEKNVPAEQIRDFTRAAARYLKLCAALMEQQAVPQSVIDDYKKMIERADDSLRFLVQQQNVDVPKSFVKPAGHIRLSKWSELLDQAMEWQLLLIEKLGYKTEKLKI